MTEPTYTITFTEAERVEFARVLSGFVAKLINARVQIENEKYRPASPAPEPAAVSHVRDRWARDRKGVEVPNPEGCTAQEVHIWKVEKKPTKNGKAEFYKVTWAQPNGQGYVDANCFDEKLFPWLIQSEAIAKQGAKATIYTVQKGGYLNVIGIRA